MTGTASLYRFAQASFADLAASLTDDEWAAPTPCTPGWTVRDVLSHVSGVADDALAGRMEGAPGEAWTASQVERNRHLSVAELLDRWSGQASDFADALQSMSEERPPFDCHTHEHDVRQAIGRPGNRVNDIVEIAGLGRALVAEDVEVRLTVEFDDGRAVVSGKPDAGEVGLRGVSRFELFRSGLGRRSRDQVCSYDWTGAGADIAAVIDQWFRFGPSPLPIIE